MKKIKKVGKGATATIYLLADHRPFSTFLPSSFLWKRSKPTNAVLAVKRFHPPQHESNTLFGQRLYKEFKLTQLSSHHHVVTVFELLKDRRGRWCIIMEYCHGGDVLTILQQISLTNDAMDCIFKQLLRGMAHLHSLGIAHRDIKPDNLLMTRQGILKITDFGVAHQIIKKEKEVVVCQGLCGSMPYWPPELFTSVEYYDGLAMDVWSAAITFYCLLYTQIPFLQATTQDPHYASFLHQHSSFNSWSALNRCDPSLQHCILSMLDPDPNLRWSIPQCLDSPWIQNIHTCYDHPTALVHHHHFT
ncbi:kinase-like domain-containing protein [Halteromyces radiatus]|uniref:kinase-like domain-containing protein n=1 Tax=Halteromyces radiatus TaxID=101107 RepID=UPI00222097D4|nr:kinase-like domain-containing protein [Halteromyces radiatus]KAI8088952.1 kinase-like domain-containing protein [Halteromyces radiatus]